MPKEKFILSNERLKKLTTEKPPIFTDERINRLTKRRRKEEFTKKRVAFGKKVQGLGLGIIKAGKVLRKSLGGEPQTLESLGRQSALIRQQVKLETEKFKLSQARRRLAELKSKGKKSNDMFSGGFF